MRVLTISWGRSSLLKVVAIGMVVGGTALILGIWSDAVETYHEPATIMGNVTMHEVADRRPAASARFGALMVIGSPAEAASPSLGRVRVRINGVMTETDDDGVFALADVAPGETTVTFATEAFVYSLVLNVPAGSTVFLHDVLLLPTDCRAHPGRIEIHARQTGARVEQEGVVDDRAGLSRSRLRSL